MRTLVAVSLVAAASGISLILWHDLRAERAVSRKLASEILAESRATPDSLPRRDAVPPQQDGQRNALAPLAADTPTVVATSGATPMSGQDLLKDPKYRRARVLQLSLKLPENYPWLASELGLTQSEADQLFLLLAEIQLEGEEARLARAPGGAVAPISQETADAYASLERRGEEAVRAHLGESRYGLWRKYNEHMAAYRQVFQIGRSFEASGLPALDDGQRRAMTEAYVAQLDRENATAAQLRAELALGPGANETRLLQLSQQVAKHQEERVERILDAAGRQLSPSHVEALARALRSQLAVQQDQKRVMRERAARQGLLLAGEQIPVSGD